MKKKVHEIFNTVEYKAVPYIVYPKRLLQMDFIGVHFVSIQILLLLCLMTLEVDEALTKHAFHL